MLNKNILHSDVFLVVCEVVVVVYYVFQGLRPKVQHIQNLNI